MKKFYLFISLLPGFFPNGSASANRVDDLSSRTETFVNTRCAETDSCDLKKFSLREEVYRVNFPDGAYAMGTRMYAIYETDKVENLERYGLSQRIRGCKFYSRRKDGKTLKSQGFVMHLAGTLVPFNFPNPVVDGFTSDPIDWSDRIMPSRHFYYRWSKVPGSFEKKDLRFYGHEKPITPVLFVRDRPGVAIFDPSGGGEATNISLQFETCIYKTAEVPMAVDPYKTDFAKPLHCLNWKSSFVFNHEKMKYESPDSIDPFCRE